MSDVSIVDTLPAGLSDASWTCTATVASACPSFAVGGINTAAVHLQPGGVAWFVLSATVMAGASGPLVNTVSVAVPAGVSDPNSGNDSASDMTNIAPPAAGMLSVSVSGSGSVTSNDMQIDCGATCLHGYSAGDMPTLTATPVAGFVFTGWLGACTGAAFCTVFVDGDQTVSATFAPASVGTHTLDVDANASYDALTDGVLILRYLFGVRGPELIAGAIGGSNPQRSDHTAITAFLDDIRPRLDIDGSGRVDPLTDGLLIVRYLAGIRGVALLNGALSVGATRTGIVALELYLQNQKP